MNALTSLAAASFAFVGSHFLLSHPLRRPLVARVGEGPFLGLYSLVALATFGWLIWAALRSPGEPLWWVAPPWLWDVAAIVMLLASILLVGSLIGNPAAPDPTGKPHIPDQARGVLAITRHPMMWSFILWAAVHAILWGSAANLIIVAAIAILSFFGALAQDAKKERLLGADWKTWERRTAFWPFAAQISGRAGWGATLPRPGVWIGGLLLWLAATWAHGWLGAPAVGLWRWVA